MALNLSKPTPHGVNAAYWRIGILNVHPRSETIQVVLDGYPDQQVRETNAVPLDRAELSLPYSDELADGGRAAVYGAIKLQEDWTDATDA